MQLNRRRTAIITLLLREVLKAVASAWWILGIIIGLTLLIRSIPQGREFLSTGQDFGAFLGAWVVGLFLVFAVAGISVAVVAISVSGRPATLRLATLCCAPGLILMLSFGGVAVIVHRLPHMASSIGESAAMLPWAFAMGSALMTWAHAQAALARIDKPVLWAMLAVVAAQALMVLTLGVGLAALAGSVLVYVIAHCWLATRTDHLRFHHCAALASNTRGLLVLALLAWMAMTWIGWVHAADPIKAIGLHVGPITTLMLVLGFWLSTFFLLYALASAVSQISRRFTKRGNPVPARWILVPALLSITWALLVGHFSEAPIRILPVLEIPSSEQQTAHAESIERQIAAKLSNRVARAGEGSAPLPVILIAAEGGGIRAAYWTAGVLTALHERYEHFSDSLFALSGVSGGSVGATIYAVVTQESLQCTAPLPYGIACPETPQQFAKAIAGADFFSPVLMSMFVAAPLRDLGLRTLEDRAAVLERSFETAFGDFGASSVLNKSFAALQPIDAPLLLPGLTDAHTGRRVVLSPLPRETRSIDPTSPAWIALGPYVRASTATFMSARFPGISPTGLIHFNGQSMRIVDGGYSDNSGVGTVVELLDIIEREAARLHISDRIRPIVLMLSNSDQPRADDEPTMWSRGAAGIFVDPISTLDAVRARNANDYREWLRRRAGERVTILEWRLPYRDQSYPLGWLLSAPTQQAMDAEIARLLIDDRAIALERATGWKVRGCEKQQPAEHALCVDSGKNGK